MSRMNQFQFRAQRLLHRAHIAIGANGFAGMGLVLLAAIGLAYAQRAQSDAAQLQARVEAARSQAAAHPADPTADTGGSGERLARFQRWFPPVEATTNDLRKIFRAAQRNHIVLSKGEYALSPIEGSGGLQKYDVILPVKENYGAVKSFVAEVLNDLPHASLAEMRVERSASLADELDTRVHFTLYYRTGGASAASGASS